MTVERSAEAQTRKSVEKSASESAGLKRGAEESAEKLLPVPSPVLFSTEARILKNSFRSTLFGTFAGRGTSALLQMVATLVKRVLMHPSVTKDCF